MKFSDLKTDCRHFRGDIPCTPHKRHGVHCPECEWYEPTAERILIIKLGAVGDVIRTTPIVRKLKSEFPKCEIHWLTKTPVVIPQQVEQIHKWKQETILSLQNTPFDIVINLDKDPEACALVELIAAKKKRGFIYKAGKPAPADSAAEAKFLTGVFDDISRENTKSYLEELFEICGYTFAGEKYLLSNFAEQGYTWDIPLRQLIIGLNTGCGGRWKSRLWPEEHWKSLISLLTEKGMGVLLLGGEQEHEKNSNLAEQTDAFYPGYFPLPKFINLVDQCDLVVTAVTMATHVAIGLQKKIVLFNNTFNRNEFELYGLGEIVEPEFDCNCYYASICPNNCMQYIYPERVAGIIEKLLRTES